jgi:hypothetical protein
MNYFHVGDHLRGIWMANVSNYLLCFTYYKVRGHAYRTVRAKDSCLRVLGPTLCPRGQSRRGCWELTAAIHCKIWPRALPPTHQVVGVEYQFRVALADRFNDPCLPCRRACAPPIQAIINTLLSKVHIKKKAGFKPTEKVQGASAFPVHAAFLARLTSLTRRFNEATLPQLYEAPVPQPVGELQLRGKSTTTVVAECVCMDGVDVRALALSNSMHVDLLHVCPLPCAAF